MADVDIKYKGSSIATMNTSGTKTLQTSGKYCEGDIVVEYTDPEKPTQSKTVTPTASGFTVSPDSGKVLSSVIVNGDADLVATNVRKGKNIFGVDGNMEEGITPSGTKNISSNGTYDVTEFASVEVAVSITTSTGKSFDVTVDTEKVGSGVYVTLVSGDSDIAAHYTEADFAILINAINVTVDSDKAYILMSSNGNKQQVDTSHGCTLRRTTSGASGSGGLNRAISNSGDATGGGVGYIRATSSGDIRFYSNSSTYRIAVGSYKVVVGW